MRSMKPTLAALATALVVLIGALASTATADQPSKVITADQPSRTDVMLLIDTTSSMTDSLKEATAEIEAVMATLSARIPDVRFGLSEVRDTGQNDPRHADAPPWRLNVPITSDTHAISAAITQLVASGGGDDAEAYSRALWEVSQNPLVGWRPDAAHLVVLVADSIPHDNDLNEGVPETNWLSPSPWDTGSEPTAPSGVPGTTINPSTNLDWQAVLGLLASGGFQLEVIDYGGDDGTIGFWENWAGRTGGKAVLGESGTFGDKLIELALGGAARACHPVRGNRTKMLLASLRCAGARAPLASVCDAKFSIASPLAKLSMKKPARDRSLVKLFEAVRGAKYRRRAPHGYANSGQVVARLKKASSAIALLEVLPGVSKATRPHDLQRIAGAMARLSGVRACADGLLSSVS